MISFGEHEDEVVVVLEWCSAHSRAPFPRAFGGGSKMRPPGIRGRLYCSRSGVYDKNLHKMPFALGFSHKGCLGTQRLSFSS